MGDEDFNFEAVQDEVLQRLPLLDITQLEECCGDLAIPIPVAKKGKRTAVRSLLLSYLTSDDLEADDDVEETLTKLNDTLERMVAEKISTTEQQQQLISTETPEVVDNGTSSGSRVVKTEVTESVSDEAVASTSGVTKIELARFRDWKVSVGTFGGENHVDYCSLCYQVAEAKDLNYKDQEIVSGMIKSMKDPLKKHCEAKGKWTLELLMRRIRSYAKVKDSDEMIDDMKACSQEPKENEINFLTRMCTMRDNILAVSKQEEHPKSEAIVQKKFLQTLAVGFRKDTIRLQLASVCKSATLDDDDLMKELNDAVAAEEQNRRKTKGKIAATNNLNAEPAMNHTAHGDDVNSQILKELSVLSGTVKQLDGLKDTVKLLEGRINSITDGGTHHSHPLVRRFIKCQPCELAGLYCRHCSYCGLEGHKQRDCPTRPKNP